MSLEKMQIRRRYLLMGGAWTLFAAGLWKGRRKELESELAERLIEFYPRDGAVLALGAYFLSLYPEEKAEGLMLEKIVSSMKAYPRWSPSDTEWSNGIPNEMTRQNFAEFIDWEYERERVLYLDGWAISATTLRVSALLVLSSSWIDRVKAVWTNDWVEPRSLEGYVVR